MNRKSGIIWPLSVIALIFISICVLNIDTYTKKGVDGHQTKIKIPLYVKGINFLGRNYEYSRLAREITEGARTDEEKALAILSWTSKNIRQVPQGMPVVDDHILNIIIRGYGTPDQFQDVFTTICEYAGIPAFWEKVYNNDKSVVYVLSFVRLRSRWCVFDAYFGRYCINNYGNIASVEDILNKEYVFNDPGAEKDVLKGVPYGEFYNNIVPVSEKRNFRVDKQRPLQRIVIEMKRGLRAGPEN